MSFTTFIINDYKDDDPEYLELIKQLKSTNANIIELNINNIQELIIDCKDKDFLKNKLKLLNTTKSEIETYPNLPNYIQRTFFGE